MSCSMGSGGGAEEADTSWSSCESVLLWELLPLGAPFARAGEDAIVRVVVSAEVRVREDGGGRGNGICCSLFLWQSYVMSREHDGEEQLLLQRSMCLGYRLDKKCLRIHVHRYRVGRRSPQPYSAPAFDTLVHEPRGG